MGRCVGGLGGRRTGRSGWLLVPLAVLGVLFPVTGAEADPAPPATSVTSVAAAASCTVRSGSLGGPTSCTFTCTPGDTLAVSASQPNLFALKIVGRCDVASLSSAPVASPAPTRAECGWAATYSCASSAGPILTPLEGTCRLERFGVDAVGTCSSVSSGAGTTNGVAHVSCDAHFTHIPATTWRPGGSCLGSAIVQGEGLAANGSTYRLLGSGSFSASFDHYEPCVVDGQPALFVSFAEGTFSISGVPAWRPATSAGGFTTTATVTGRFSWNRLGLHPAITVSDLVVSFADGVGSPVSRPGARGIGTATFVPPGSFDSSRHLLCGQPGGPLSIPVEIAAGLALP